MGLDVNLLHVPDTDVKKIVAYNKLSRNYFLRSAYYHLSRKDSSHTAEWENRVASHFGLPEHAESRISGQSKKIEIPSVKHPNYLVGYFRSGYLGGGINDVLRCVVGRNLYYAFPEAKGNGGYIQPNWRRSLQRLQKMRMLFQAKGPEDARFNEAIGVNQESGRNLIRWLKPTTSEGFRMAASVTKSLEADSQFQDYVEQLGAVIETVEYVLAQPDAEKYIFYWSA